MKKNILIIVICSMTYFLFNSSSLFAQGNANKKDVGFPEKFLVSFDATGFAGSKEVLAKNKINLKALTDFQKSFKAVNDEKWYKENYGFSARFFENGIQTDVNYSEKGERLYTIKQYDENKLPGELRHAVKGTFYNCSINWVHEVIFPRKTVYVVLIEDETTLKNIRICNEEMEVMDEITKS